jgi:hypothetical protein
MEALSSSSVTEGPQERPSAVQPEAEGKSKGDLN